MAPETLRRSQPLSLSTSGVIAYFRFPFGSFWFLTSYNVPYCFTQYLIRLYFCMMASEDVPLHFQDAKSTPVLWHAVNRRSRTNRVKTIGLSVIGLFFFFFMLQSSSTVRIASCATDML